MENENLIMNEEPADVGLNETQEEEPKRSKIGLILNKFFHFYDRGSSMKQEILAGLSVFLISMCALFMNIQILASGQSDPSFTGLYLGATIISFIGTMVIGLVCNLPLVQVSSLGLSSVFISMIGANTGLTYHNLLAISFISAILYVVLVSVPVIKKYVFAALPKSVRKALPAAIGLYVAYIALEKIGIINGLSLTKFLPTTKFINFCIIMGVVGILLALILKRTKMKHPYLISLIIVTVLFYLVGACGGDEIFSSVFSTNRVWIGINPDPTGEMYTIDLGFKGMNFGSVFTDGFDFSAFTAAGGSVFAIFLEGILMFMFMGMYESEGSIAGAELNGSFLVPETAEKKVGLAIMINAATNVIAPLFGSSPISVAKQSSVATGDGGKTGLSSVVCGLGYLLIMFTWIPFVLFATYTNVVPEYGHAGFVFSNIIFAAFGIADAVMFIVGIMMLKAFKNCDWSDMGEWLPFVFTVIGTVFTQNIVFGVAFGMIAYILLKLTTFKLKNIKSITVPTAVLTVILILLVILAL